MNKETIQKINECLQKIKDIDQKRCNEASERHEIWDSAITHWAITAQSMLPDSLEDIF